MCGAALITPWNYPLLMATVSMFCAVLTDTHDHRTHYLDRSFLLHSLCKIFSMPVVG